jgi:membrane-associated phospholipid phosphatase
MMKLNNCLKLCWAIFVVLELCLMESPALADMTSVMTEHSQSSLSRQALLNSEESQLEALRLNSLYPLTDDFIFSGTDDEPLLAANKTYSSVLKERPERKSLRGKIILDSNYFKGIFEDTGYAMTSPLRWDKLDWATASIVAGVTGVFFVLDDEINSEIKDNRSSTTDAFFDVFEPFGNSAITIPAMVGFYMYGRFGENEKVERTALLASESFLVTSLFTGALKVGMGRVRPAVGGIRANDFRGPLHEGAGHSFPSGHTSSAFAIATVIANEYENVPLLTPISYGIASLTALSRLNDEKHWASDVFFGAALGYFTSKTILKLHSNKKGRHFTIYPRVDQRGGGLSLSTRF